MIVGLRFIGTLNAAFWFGASLFFTVIVGPALFSQDMLSLFGWPARGATAKYWTGSVAQVLVARFFITQFWCGIIALAHLLGEWLLTGRPLQRWVIGLLLLLLGLNFVEIYWLQPKMIHLHNVMYGLGEKVTLEQAQNARASFALFHGTAQVANLLVLAGLGAYLWQICRHSVEPRFLGRVKMGWE